MTGFRTLGIAVGAGCASALLFVATAQGAGVAMLMGYLTPLPIMIAALGFGHATGLVAAAVACLGLGGYLGLLPGLVFGLLLGFPSWWLPYLVLLARPLPAPAPTAAAPAAPSLVIWYPVGRVVLWAAGLVAAVILVIGGVLMLRYGGFEPTVTLLSGRLDTIIGESSAGQLSAATTTRRVVQILPVLTAAATFFILTLNLWLAGRIVERSALLSRPWPSLPENIRLPRQAVLVLLAGCLAVVPGGAVRVAGGVVAVSLAMAFALQGLAAAHALTRGLAARRLILLAIYLVTFSVVPSLVALAVLGVVDCLLPLRHRAQPASPPLTKT